jgi:pseudaminic acid synthase
MVLKVNIGNDFDPFLIAEISGNHNGSLSRAIELVHAAHESGADAVKIQTYTAETMTIRSTAPQFYVSDTHELWGGTHLYDLYQNAHTPWAWHEELFSVASTLGIIAFSTPFDPSAVDFLESLEVPMYKIASLEINDHELIQKVAATGKPVIISTGASTLDEAIAATRVAKECGSAKVIALKCTSSYPSDPRDANLRAMQVLARETGTDVGLSDHTLGIAVSIAAVALGATVIEKHITLGRNDGGVDSAFSLEPEEFSQLVIGCRDAHRAVGDDFLAVRESEGESFSHRRSLYIVKDVKQGDVVSRENVRAIRPSGGLEPFQLTNCLGLTFNQGYQMGTPLKRDMIF